ncbi:Replication termination factor 2 [Linum perenne]
MHSKSHQVFLRTPNSRILQTLTFDPSQTLTLRDLKLSLVPHHGNPNSFYFTVDGKLLHDDSQPIPHIPALSTLSLRHRLLGGGGDGGATGAESRDCYLKMYAEKKPDKVDPNEQRLSKWVNCALSYETLRQPCVIDRLGNVFNKEALVEALIGKKLPKAFGHIKGLKDMIDIKLEPISGGVESNNAWFQCPITDLEFNGTYKFFALRKCGHVLSAKALKEVKSSACLVCYKEFEECDKIVINGSEEEVEVLRARMEEERAKVREKKQKKVKNGDVVVGNGVNNGEEGVDVIEESTKLSGKKHGIVDGKDVQKANAKGEKMNAKIESNKRFKAVDIAPAHATKAVYASLFTSSQKKKDFRETYSCRSLPLGRN